jgi:hypothetical protein
MNRQPVLLLVLVAVLTEAGGAVILLANDHTTAGIAVAVGTFLTGVGGALARQMVTPMADPKTGEGEPLVPISQVLPEDLQEVGRMQVDLQPDLAEEVAQPLSTEKRPPGVGGR